MTEVPIEGKLVRDRVPEIIAATGVTPVCYTAGDAEYRARLRDKLVEEVGEFLAADEAGAPQELVDVVETVYAIAVDLGIGVEGLEEIRAAKAAGRGGFAGRIVWTGNVAGVDFETLIAASSLGAPHVRAAIERVPESLRQRPREATAARAGVVAGHESGERPGCPQDCSLHIPTPGCDCGRGELPYRYHTLSCAWRRAADGGWDASAAADVALVQRIGMAVVVLDEFEGTDWAHSVPARRIRSALTGAAVFPDAADTDDLESAGEAAAHPTTEHKKD